MIRHQVPVHVFQGDGIPDHNGDERCAHCKMPETRTDLHQLPDVDDPRKHAILGEREEKTLTEQGD